MALPDHFLQELTARTDLVSLVSGYTALKQSGGIWTGLCPFHNEKTPSFSLSRDNTMYYCFGCQSGGGAVQFMMQAQNLSFIEAVRELARMANMEVPEDRGNRGGLRRSRLLELNKTAAVWFYRNLRLPEGRQAAEYLEKRGLTPKTARRFGLGAAPDGWEGLIRHLQENGAEREEMVLAGLARQTQSGRLIDAFSSRLMFPIFDPGGHVIAFSGRALKEGQMPKYKNSAETAAYSKSRTLYGLHLAKNSERPYFILVEGNVDVPVLHQHGMDSAVASCGTALTEAQVKLLSQYKKEVVLAYDSDAAGQSATQKAITKLESAGLKIRVLTLTGAKDPDEYLGRYGPGALEALLSGAENQMDYRVQTIAAQYDLTQDLGRRDFLLKGEELLMSLPTEAERQIYAGRIAALAGVGTDAVLRDLEVLRRKRRRAAEKTLERDVIYPRRRVSRTEEQLLLCMLRAPEYAARAAEELTAEDFLMADTRSLFEALLSPEGGGPAGLPPKDAALAARLQMSELDISDAAFNDLIERLREQRRWDAVPEADDDLRTMQQQLLHKKKYE